MKSEKRTMVWGAPWWLAREGPGLGIGSCPTGNRLHFPSSISLSCEVINVS